MIFMDRGWGRGGPTGLVRKYADIAYFEYSEKSPQTSLDKGE